MALELQQQMRLTQQLVMTPQLQQAIKLLQLSRLELLETINQEMETNPVLEEGTEEGDASSDSTEPAAAESTELEPMREVEVSDKNWDEFDWESYLGDYSAGTPVVRETDSDRDWPSYDHRLTNKDSLGEHLLWQLRLSDASTEDREIASCILGNLDENGYLRATVEEIAEMAEDDLDQVEKVLALVQKLDPVGVAARDLKECLLVQALALHPENELVPLIISKYLSYLEKRDYAALVRALKRKPQEVKEAVDIILSLDPRPGSAFVEETVQYISPDIYVLKVDGEFVLLLNEDGMPKLRISPYYRKALGQDSTASAEAKDYIQDKLRSAAWLIKSIHQRQRTLYRVTRSIVELQRDFFENGVGQMKPMVLRDVADDVGMHESTISRVTANKYVHTQHGIFELKYFFNSSINSVVGEAVASETVKEKIRQIVRSEDQNKPYSDKEIVDLLKRENVSIARRTVAKYREMMGILPSNKRRQVCWDSN